MELALKRKCFLTPRQEKWFRKYAGASRYAYNWGLTYAADQHKLTAKFPLWRSIRNEFLSQKDVIAPWNREINSTVFNKSFEHLGVAFKKWFQLLKKSPNKSSPNKSLGFPKYKNRFSRTSFTIECSGGLHITKRGVWSLISFPSAQKKENQVGKIKIRDKESYLPETIKGLDGKYRTANGQIIQTVHFTQNGSWYVSIILDRNIATIHPNPGSKLGIDINTEHLDMFGKISASASHFHLKVNVLDNSELNPEDKTDYQSLINDLKARQIKVQEQLSKEYDKNKKYFEQSVRYFNLKKKNKNLYARISRIMQDWRHKLSSRISDVETINMEQLDITNMVSKKDRNISKDVVKKIINVAPYEIRRQVNYKAKKKAGKMQEVQAAYSSLTCSKCGNRNTKKEFDPKTYHTFTCDKCGFSCDRDKNASINIYNAA
jgi:putative transposase